MAALVCDICGGNLVMGSGGIAVCDSCGMEHSPDRMKEKIQEVKGVVRVDNTHMVDNWMKMGHAAAQAGNNKEAYEYFTKVIEVDPFNWRAIFEKGKAGAWQSTLANLRISELYQGIKMALEIIESLALPEEELISINNEFAVTLFNINNAITDLLDQNLADLDDKYFDARWDQMWNTRQRYITNVAQLEDAPGLICSTKFLTTGKRKTLNGRSKKERLQQKSDLMIIGQNTLIKRYSTKKEFVLLILKSKNCAKRLLNMM